LLALGFAQISYAQCGTFYDGFESGTWNTVWTPAGGTYTQSVTTTNPGAGTYSFEQTGNGSHTQGVVATFVASTPTSISYKVKTSAASTTGAYCVIGDVSTPSNLGIFFCYFASSGLIRVYSSGSAVYQQAYSANTWYTIELRNINFTTKTYDIWINNVLGVTNHPFRSQGTTAIDRIYLYNLSSPITATYDDILIGGSPLNIISTGSSVSCPSDSNGTATTSVTGGTPNYSYLWSTLDTTISISNLLPGTYYVTITDSNGCVGNDSAVVAAPSAITSTTISADALCNGDSTGAIDLSVSGGSPPYTYGWSNGATAEDPSGIPTGIYSVLITDSNGCTWSDTATVGEPTPVTLNAIVSNLACNGDSSGSIDLTATGGTPGYSYTWNTSATSEDISGLLGGTYSVFVSDSNGCSTGDIYTVNEPAALVSSGTATDDTGGGNGAIDLTVSGGTAPFTFAWSNSATTEDLSGLTAGTYTVVVTDSNGCMTMDTFVIDLIIGIDAPNAGPQLTLYPNPGTGQVTVVAGLPASGTINLSVADLRGRIIYQQETEVFDNSWKTQLDLRGLSPGVYMLRLESNGQSLVRRYVKQ
jgi:hypothetical protein